jgi:hypothetical protein
MSKESRVMIQQGGAKAKGTASVICFVQRITAANFLELSRRAEMLLCDSRTNRVNTILQKRGPTHQVASAQITMN